ncbi:hypothetical protein C7Y70_14200 [Pseudoalteromonas sp. KS88]|uniref:PKD domain-containing protein n=1 Tax=Pseudoalteromonas sp. KS88 TaxID=2109918 RepID=UPI001081A723|nr:hypothetical protein [Pseudoalteromonas sp. KS88]TGE81048.1 hypothetical protein C7Y70_14200 [Pseudoalteromonas sp. KS88]
MSVSNRLHRSGVLALLTSAFIITGCGGGGGDSGDSTPPAISNNSPTVSISGDAEVNEGKELSLTAVASDSDGSITSYAWQAISGPTVTLAGSDSENVSFTAPNIEEDTDLVLEVTVTDNEGATKSAQITVNIKREVLSVTITGIVTDEPIVSSNIAVQVGDDLFEVTADETGQYTVKVEVDDSFANKLVRLVALGNNAINPEVEFVSQLKSVATLITQAGDDATLTKNENFGVNITNVSTAEYALVKRDNGDVQDEASLSNALLAVDANEKLLLASLIKIIVDDENYTLPEGVDSTLALVSNANDIDNFVNTVDSQDPDLIEATKKAIKDDDDLIDKTIGDVTGEFILTMPQSYRAAAAQLHLLDEEKGYISFTGFETNFTWQQTGPSISMVLDEAALESCAMMMDENNQQQESCQYLVELGMTILLENDVNKTVELYRKFERRWSSTGDVHDSYEGTTNFSLIEKQQTIAITADKLIGTWVVDGASEFQGLRSAVSFDLLAGGAGTLRDNDKAPVSITWQIIDNRLVITNTNEEAVFDYEFWLIKDVQVGYQFVSSLNAKADESTRTSSGLMVKDNQLAFTTSELLGKWTIYQGYNAPQTDLHYDVYDDGLMNFNLNQDYRSWQIGSEGEFLRYNYFTDNGVQPVCPEGQTCQVYSEFSQRLLATANDQNFTYRKYRFYNFDGSERPQNYSSHLRNFSVANGEYGVTRFAPYWIQENPGFDENGYPTNVNYIELYTPNSKGVEAITIATNYNEQGEPSSYTISFTNAGVTQSYDYSLASGKLLFSDQQIEIKDFERNFLTVCIYAQGGVCNEANTQAWYFDEAMAAENVQAVRPQPTHPLDGAWQLADEPDVVLVLRDGKWIQIQSIAVEGETDAFPGYEIGDFTWNEATGDFTVNLTEDTNGAFGYDSDEPLKITVNADELTFSVEGEGDYRFTRIYDPSKPHVGAYFSGSIANNDFFLAVFKGDGYFTEFDHEVGFTPAINAGTYTYTADPSGDPELLSVTLDYYLNQMQADELEEIEPYVVIKGEGNRLVWLDGNDFGVDQRVTNIVDPIELVEADVVGEHVLSYLDQGASMEHTIVVRNDGTTSFTLAGETREGTWSIDLGSLKLVSPESSTQDATYGMVITPHSVVAGGFEVAAFSVTVPSNHPDKEDPNLHISVMGSFIKQ